MPRAAITKAPKKTAKRPAAKAVRKSATTKIAKKSATSKPSKKSVPKKVAKKPVATKRKVTPKKPEIISTKNLTLYQFSTETTTVSTITRARSLDPSDFEAKCQKQSMYDSFRNGNYVTHEFCIYRQRSETYDSDNSYRSDRYGEREGSHCEECCDCCSLYGSDLEEESEEENIVTENVYYLGQDRAIQKVLEERTGEAMPEDKEELMALWREYGVDVDAEGLPTDDWENDKQDKLYEVQKKKVKAVLMVEKRKKVVVFKDEKGKDMGKINIEDWDGEPRNLKFSRLALPKPPKPVTKVEALGLRHRSLGS